MELIKAIKKLFGPTLDHDDDKCLEDDINTYKLIMNYSKYSDAQTPVDPLEKLMEAMQLDEPEPDQDPKQESAIQTATKDNKCAGPDSNGDLELPGKQQQRANHSNTRIAFLERLAVQRKLLQELEGEYATVLPAPTINKVSTFQKLLHIPNYNIPTYIYDAIERDDFSRLNLDSPLTPSNYVNRFQNLLWLEEAYQAVDLHRYDMNDILLARYDNRTEYFLIAVPGLAEGRPSLMKGDHILLSSVVRSNYFEGTIFEVRRDDILIRLHDSLHKLSHDGLRYNVTFMSSRLPFRRCHYGINQYQKNNIIRKLAFPEDNSKTKTPLISVIESTFESLRCFNQTLNQYQKQTVFNIINASARPGPYVLFGPCGTGKTVTLVEVALQVYARKKTSKILICANSNTCIDYVATLILNSGIVPSERLLRITAYYRMDRDLIPENLSTITETWDTLESDGRNSNDFNIVMTTCSQSAVLYNWRQQYEFILIDEAGHASEPECMIPAGLLQQDGCLVLAGDPKQLGPVCMAQVSASKGLGKSWLERVFSLPMYRIVEGSYNPTYVSKLLICYRSDERLLSVNNELFYNNELQFTVKTPQRWLDLLRSDNPLIFHSVKGKNHRDHTTPSWFNADEAIVLIGYVNLFYSNGLKPSQLGIISPYRRQIDKLKMMFESCNLKLCKIGTMEEYQGDEREVIIVSTVRTSAAKLAIDKNFNLGFLHDPKRFNVAITRAKWIVITVGDPNILGRDKCWQMYMERAHKALTVC